MKRFIIEVSTSWCGMDDSHRAIAEKESDLWDIAGDLARDNFESYDCYKDIASEYGYDSEEMTDGDWDRLWEDVNEEDYYSYFISEFTGTDEEWEEYGGYIYGKDDSI